MPQAIQELSSGPVDIIGDVHGELEALNQLLAHLGYDRFGRHPQNRTLVFMGDLIDRGPDSPGVVEKVSSLYLLTILYIKIIYFLFIKKMNA